MSNDASIKKLNNASISRTGTYLDGTYLSGDIIPDSSSYRNNGYTTAIQSSGKLYIQHMDTDSSGQLSVYYIDGKIYDLLYV